MAGNLLPHSLHDNLQSDFKTYFSLLALEACGYALSKFMIDVDIDIVCTLQHYASTVYAVIVCHTLILYQNGYRVSNNATW